MIEAVFETERLNEFFHDLLAYDTIVLAVSGGSDSVALMRLIAAWHQQVSSTHAVPAVHVLTVDHGLRAEAPSEAEFVAGKAAAFELCHDTLHWVGDKPQAGLQEAAREARYALMSDFVCQKWPEQKTAIVTAHTQDDQVETFLMRLARGSGLSGLSAMDSVRPIVCSSSRHDAPAQVALVRPLLGVSKEVLRAHLVSLGGTWIEDPTNDDTTYERVRLRQAHAALADLGLTPEKIGKSISRLRRADNVVRNALKAMIDAVDLQQNHGAFAKFSYASYAQFDEELRIRFLIWILRAYGDRTAPPKLAKVEELARSLASHSDAVKRTLSGAIVVAKNGEVIVVREPGRTQLAPLTLAPGQVALWDQRFVLRLSETSSREMVVKTLDRDVWRDLSRDTSDGSKWLREAFVTLPSFWAGEQLVGVPHLDEFSGHGGSREVFSCNFVLPDVD